MLTTLQQAKKLKKLGYDEGCTHFFKINEEDKPAQWFGEYHNHNMHFEYISAPTISEALDWFREVKGIPCSVHLEFEINNSEWFYYGEWGIKGENKVNTTETLDSHSIAESALLDEIIKYSE